MKERKKATILIRRIIACALAVLLVLDMNVTGLIRTLFTGGESNDDVSVAMAAEPDNVKFDDYDDLYLMPNLSIVSADGENERADAAAHNYFEYLFNDGDTYWNNYCSTYNDKRKGLDIIRQEKDIINKIYVLNNKLKGNNKITYDSKSRYTSFNRGGKIISSQNYLAGGHGFVVSDATSVSESGAGFLPGSMKLGKNEKYTRAVMVNDLIDGSKKTVDYNISIKVDSISGKSTGKGFKVVLKDSTGKEIASQICTTAGQTLTMSGNIDINKINKDKSDGFRYLYLELSSKMADEVRLSALKFLLPSKETMLEEAYLTNLPIPAGDTAKDGKDHRGILSYTKADADDMYVVLRFDGPVKLGKMLYRDSELTAYSESKYGYTRSSYLRAYPRLALAITDSSGVEKNTKNSTVFADYCGTMSSINYSGTEVSDSCLIFKLDLDERWKHTSFSIPALGKQVTRTGRDGNMEWINACQKFDPKQRETYNKIFTRKSLQLNETDRMYKGAIKDAGGNRMVVEEGFPLQPVAGKDINGNDVKRMPVYDGSDPKIKEINIHTDNKSGYVKKGDNVGIDVVFNCKLDTSVPTPVFYLDEYLIPFQYVGRNYTFNDETKKYSTKVSGGVYTNARMVPLNASLRIDKNDASNKPMLGSNEATPSIQNNKRGAAYMTITGARSGDGYTTFYKVVRESSEIRNAGETFDPSGWTVYNGTEVYLDKLPTALYRYGKNGTLDRALDGGFIDICVAKLDDTNRDNEGNPQYTIITYGESDEINTTSDSEAAMKQINNEAESENTVIHYDVPITGWYGHKNVNLVCCDDDGIYDPNSIYFEGTVKNLAGDEMTHTKNYGVFSYSEDTNRLELISDWKSAIIPQNTNVSYDKSAPNVYMNIEDSHSDNVDIPSRAVINYVNNSDDTDFCASPMQDAVLKIGNVNEKVHIRVIAEGLDDPVFEGNIEAGTTGNYAKVITLDPLYWSSGNVVVEAKRVDNSKAGTKEDVIVPVTLEGVDEAGNINSKTGWMRLVHPYIETMISTERMEPVVRKYIQQAEEQMPGNITLRVLPRYKSSSYDVGKYEVYLLDPADLGLKRDEVNKDELLISNDPAFDDKETVSDRLNIDYNTLKEKGKPAYSLKPLDDPSEATKENGGYAESTYKVSCRYLQGNETKDVDIKLTYGNNGHAMVYIPEQDIYDYEICDEMFVSFDVPVRVAFDKIAYVAYHDESNGLSSVEYCDLYMDTSDVGPIKSTDEDGNHYVEQFVEYSKANEDDIEIDYAPGSFLEDGSGRLKRTNSYKFVIRSTTDIYWNAGNWNFIRNDGMPNAGKLIGGRLKASEEDPLDIVFDTSAIPLEYLWTPAEGGLSEDELELLRMNGVIYTKADGKEYIKLSCNGDYTVSKDEYADPDKPRYGSLGVFGGASWQWKCDLIFAPYTTKTTRYLIHDISYNDDGSFKEDTVTENVNEQIGEEVTGSVKRYTLDILDEEFVKRGPKYPDLELQDSDISTYGTYSNTNRLFLELDSEYNSLNGYDAYQGNSTFSSVHRSIVEPVTFVLGENASEYINPDTDIDYANSYIEIWPVDDVEGDKIFGYKKKGDKPVRTIPLPCSFEDVTYKRYQDGTDNTVNTKGITVDINAYMESEEEFTNEDDEVTKITSYTLPKDGTYAAYVHIATYLTDKDGKQVVITSKDHYSGRYRNRDENGFRSETDNADEMVSVEVPLAVYTYDRSAPDVSLSIGSETEEKTVTYEELKQWKEDNDIDIDAELSVYKKNYYADKYDDYVESYNEYHESMPDSYPEPSSGKDEYVEFNCLLYLWSMENGIDFSYYTSVSDELIYTYSVWADETKDVYRSGEYLGIATYVLKNEPEIKDTDRKNRRILRYAFVTDEFIDDNCNFISDMLDDITVPTVQSYTGQHYVEGEGWVNDYEELTIEEYMKKYDGSGYVNVKTDDDNRPLLNNWGYRWDGDRLEENLTLPACPKDCNNIYLVSQVIDAAGNESGFIVRKYTIDGVGPSAELYSVVKPDKNDPATDKKYVRAAKIRDNHSGIDEITVTSESVNGGTPEDLEEPVLLKDYSKWIGVNDTLTVTVADSLGNESEITLSEDAEVHAPTVTTSSGMGENIPVIVTNDDIDMAGLKTIQDSYDGFGTIIYEGNDANNTPGFELDLNSNGDEGYIPTVEYAFSSDTYKQIYSEDTDEDENDYTSMWQEAEYVPEIYDKAPGNGMVNVVYSGSANDGLTDTDRYTVKTNILLPADKVARNYVITFRFGNGTGQYVYKTIGYTVPALPDGNRISFTPAVGTNAQTLVFNEPLKIITRESGDDEDDPAEYTTSTKVYFDYNGKYTINYVDLKGDTGKQTLLLNAVDKSWVPDIEKTYNDDGTVTIELDSGYKNAYGMTFASLKGDGYEITPTDDELRMMTVGEGEAAVTVYKYAKVTASGNASFVINIYSPDENEGSGVRINNFTYDVGGFARTGHEYELQYSRTKTITDSSNKYDPVDVRLIIPEGTEILSTDGDSYTFTENRSYKFTVRYADGYVMDIPAEVDCISEREADDEDYSAPVIDGINYYIRNDAETIDITEYSDNTGVPESAPLTNSKVYAKIRAIDLDTAGEINPLKVTLEDYNSTTAVSDKKVVLDENDPLTVIFSVNASVKVTIEDLSGQKVEQYITVSNITDRQLVTGNVRYVRCGLTQTKAYIDLPEGVSLRDMNGIQTLEKTGVDAGKKVEYYHLFTQSGTFTFKLTDGKGNIADITTRQVEVDREPLILEEKARTPETPDWGEPQLVDISANLYLESVELLNPDGTRSDLTVYANEKKASINFNKNATVILDATAVNGSKARLTVSADKIRSNPEPPDLILTKEYVPESNMYKITAKAIDSLPAGSYSADCDIHIEPPKDAVEFDEGELLKDNGPITMVLTREASFCVAESGTYSVKAYNMAAGSTEKSVDITLDTEAPELTITEDSAKSSATHKAYKASITEDGYIWYAGNGTEEVVETDDEGNVIMSYKTGLVKAGEEYDLTIDKNGSCVIKASDTAGNETEKEIMVTGLDEEAPKITSPGETIAVGEAELTGRTTEDKAASLKDILAGYFEVSDDVSAPSEITKNIILPEYVTSDGMLMKGTYTAQVEAYDKAGRKSRVSFIFILTVAEVKTYPELKEFGVNGTPLKENGYYSADDTTLTLGGVPAKASVYYAKGDYTGAQMKYKGNKVDGMSISAERGCTYTIMLKLKDLSIHIYHVVVL